MDELYSFYTSQLEQFNVFEPSLYRVARYMLGHRTLIIMSELFNDLYEAKNRRFLILEGIQYMKLYPSWMQTALKLAMPNQQATILRQENLSLLDNSPLVFYAKPTEGDILIVCARMYLSEKMPRLPDFTFD